MSYDEAKVEVFAALVPVPESTFVRKASKLHYVIAGVVKQIVYVMIVERGHGFIEIPLKIWWCLQNTDEIEQVELNWRNDLR